jgi:hypothetical protein
VVSHHLDGFGKLRGLGLLRPSTGQDSLNFEYPGPHPKMLVIRVPSRSAQFTPFEDFPSLVAVPHHCGRCPLDVRQVNVPLDDLTAAVAFIPSGSTFCGPKAKPAE